MLGVPPKPDFASVSATLAGRGGIDGGLLGSRRAVGAGRTAFGAGRRTPGRRRTVGRAGALGPWLCVVRRAQVPARLRPFRLRQPDRAEGRHALPAQPGSALELRQVQPVHDHRQRAGRADAVRDRAARRAGGRRAADDVRRAGRGDAGRARQVVDQLPDPSEGALPERRPGDRGRRQVQLRVAGEQVRRARLPDRAGRGREGDGDRRADDPLRPEGSLERHGLHARRAARVLAQVGARAGRPAEALRPDRHRVPDRERPVPDRRRGLGPAPRAEAQPRLLGEGRRLAARLLQLRPHRLPLLPGPGGRARGVQGRRVRHLQGVRRAQLGAPAQGPEVGRRADQERPVRDGSRPGPAVVPAEPAPAEVPGHARPRSARLHLRLRHAEPPQALQADQQPLQQLRLRRRGPAVAG